MMYSKEDIKEVFDKLKDLVVNNTNEEISYYLNMNCIYYQV